MESIWAVFIRADGGKSRWRSMSTCILSEVKAQPIRICVCAVIPIMAEEVKANLSLKVCSTFSISFCSLSICTIICFSYSECHVNNAKSNLFCGRQILKKNETYYMDWNINSTSYLYVKLSTLSVLKVIACVFIRKWDNNKMICTIFLWPDGMWKPSSEFLV